MTSHKKQYPYLVIFDLDGVLIDSRDIHEHCLNEALKSVDVKYVISHEEHLARYDGLPTTKKLELLTKEKGLPADRYDDIWKDKQEATLGYFRNRVGIDHELVDIMEALVEEGVSIGFASNSIRKTLVCALYALGVFPYGTAVGNTDVSLSKPHPEMYWNLMTYVGTIPSHTVIVEDSHIGRQGVIDSGANLLAVDNRKDLTKEKVMRAVADMKAQERPNVPWIDNKLNVLIPMAGAGSRFADAGYTFPKPLIEVDGKPMIQRVVENLNIDAHFIFMVQREHLDKYNLDKFFSTFVDSASMVVVDELTEGAACTTLLAKQHINNDRPLLIANSDQILEWNSNEVMYAFSADNIDGGILTFKATHPKWSFAKLDDNGFVSEVAEKNPISDNATCGIYYWTKGSDYVKYAERMIEADDRTNGEFYVCPVFNHAISDGKRFRIKEVSKMWGIGTPEDLETYLRRDK